MNSQTPKKEHFTNVKNSRKTKVKHSPVTNRIKGNLRPNRKKKQNRKQKWDEKQRCEDFNPKPSENDHENNKANVRKGNLKREDESLLIANLNRCPWCNGYRRWNWTRRHEFKSWTRLIAFHIALIHLGKI